jgi:hypothetical protein
MVTGPQGTSSNARQLYLWPALGMKIKRKDFNFSSKKHKQNENMETKNFGERKWNIF